MRLQLASVRVAARVYVLIEDEPFVRFPSRMRNRCGTDTHLSLSSQTNFLRGPNTLLPGFSSSSSSEAFFSPSSQCCLSLRNERCVSGVPWDVRKRGVKGKDDRRCQRMSGKNPPIGTYFATLAMQSMLYRAICSGITLHTASFSSSSGIRILSS